MTADCSLGVGESRPPKYNVQCTSTIVHVHATASGHIHDCTCLLHRQSNQIYLHGIPPHDAPTTVCHAPLLSVGLDSGQHGKHLTAAQDILLLALKTRQESALETSATASRWDSGYVRDSGPYMYMTCTGIQVASEVPTTVLYLRYMYPQTKLKMRIVFEGLHVQCTSICGNRTLRGKIPPDTHPWDDKSLFRERLLSYTGLCKYSYCS